MTEQDKMLNFGMGVSSAIFESGLDPVEQISLAAMIMAQVSYQHGKDFEIVSPVLHKAMEVRNSVKPALSKLDAYKGGGSHE